VELHTVEVGVAADLTILVSRNADGDLHSGAVAVLRRVDGVADVRNLRVTCIRPRSNARPSATTPRRRPTTPSPTASA
jgi:hypothetical protein